MIEQADLKGQYASLKGDIDDAVARVLGSGRYINGPEVDGLEREFARFCETPHAVAVSSGTDALRLSLIAVMTQEGLGGRGIPQGRAEVVTSPFCFAATTEAISQAGARAVFADIDPATFTLEPQRVSSANTPRTRAIIPVHLFGHPADMESLTRIAKGKSIAIVEDVCQAHGARSMGRAAGSMGEAGCFSFYPTKNLGACGDGGMMVTESADIATRVRRLRDHGQIEKYRHIEEGSTARLDEVQAAILRVKLKHLEDWNERRRALARRYIDGLRGIDITLPTETPESRHVYHLFTVRLKDREGVRTTLAERGIATGVHYPIPLHLQPVNTWMGLGEGAFPESERAAQEVLSLPLFPEMTEEQVDLVCGALREVVARR